MIHSIRRSRFPRMPLLALPLAVGLAWTSGAGASSFALLEANGSGLGNAYAGAGAVAEDASTIWFNPAGMTYLPPRHSIAVSGVVLHRSLEFSNNGSTQFNPFIPLGTDGGDAGGTSVIPAGYYAFAVSPQLRFGVGVSAPFGNKTEWDDSFIGRYQGTKSDIKAININPSVAWRVNNMVSIGAGASYMKFEAELQNKVPVSPTVDANVKLEGDDSSWAWNVGAIFQVSESTRVGLTYRSETKLDLTGSVSGAINQDARVSIKLPDTWSVSVFQRLDDRWEMMGDLTRTGWGSLPELAVKNSSGGPISTESLGYEDVWRIGLGANYRYNSNWKLRFGVAYDKTPISNDESRIVRLPDTDRTWLSVGANWRITPTSSLDMGYTHIFFKNGNINRPTTLPGSAQVVRGKFETSADLLSVQYSASF